jgi:hypothetical protein
LPGAALALGIGFVLDAAMLVHFATRLLRVGPTAVLLRCWRPVLASAGMALALWAAGLGWAPAPANAAAATRDLAVGVGCGVLVSATVAAALWAACGRPEGAENDLLRMLGRLAQRLRPARPVALPASPGD